MSWSLTVALLISVGMCLAIASSFSYSVLGKPRRAERDMECMFTDFADITHVPFQEQKKILSDNIAKPEATGAFVFVDKRKNVSDGKMQDEILYGVAIGYAPSTTGKLPIYQTSFVTRIQPIQDDSSSRIDDDYVSYLDQQVYDMISRENAVCKPCTPMQPLVADETTRLAMPRPQIPDNRERTYAKPIVDSSLV